MTPQITRWRVRRWTAGIVVMVALFMAAGCGSERELASPQNASPSSGQSRMGAHSAAELKNAATAIIGFLQGSAGFEQFEVAERVSLHLSPEGGGTWRELSREMLRDRFNWTVRSEAFDHIYSFIPPQAEWELTTRVGRHLNCGYDYALATRVEHMAAFPHVGTTLHPRNGESCLQSWNLTFVFDPKVKPLTLVAVVYNQWEW